MKAWETASPGNVCGVASALTTLAPLPHNRVWQPRLMFWARRVLGPPRALAPLSFIYFARTALVTDVDPDHAYIYFESHFNGGFDEYIDVFSYVVPQHMKRIWSTADGFPGPQPSTRFNKYIRKHDFEAAHFYSAYPKATVTDVGRALDLRDDLSRLAGSRANPEKFAKRWNDLWRPPAPPPSPGFSLASLFNARDTNVVRKGRVYGLTVLHPIEGDKQALATTIAALGRDPSPFARVHGTHFARLVILDPWAAAPRHPAPHLLFSCIVDGVGDSDVDAYLERLCASIPTDVKTIWGQCTGMPDSGAAEPAAFRRWLRSGQLTTTTFFGPYGRATVHEVQTALRLRDGARTLARELQYETPDVVRRKVQSFLTAHARALR